MSLNPGQKVVCIWSSPGACGRPTGLIKGLVYTISDVGYTTHGINGPGQWVRLMELPAPTPDLGWMAERFRPWVSDKLEVDEYEFA